METVEAPQSSKKKFWKTPIFFIAFTLIVGIVSGFSIGRYATPPEIQVETKVETVSKMPAECQVLMVALGETVNKYVELHKTLTHNIEGLLGSTDWDMPVVIATKTYQEEEILGLTTKYNEDYPSCEPYLLTE